MLQCWSEAPEDRPAFGQIVDEIQDMETVARTWDPRIRLACSSEVVWKEATLPVLAPTRFFCIY